MQNEAENLRSLFATVKNRAAFAREHDVPGGPAMIYQHINGMKPISLECAVAYSRGFGVPIEKISPRLAELLNALPKSTTDTGGTPLPEAISKIVEVARRMDTNTQYILLGRAQELLLSSVSNANTKKIA